MDERNRTKKSIVSGIWYIWGGIFTKGFAFLITPILTRMLSTSEYADYTNYLAWYSFIIIFTSLELSSTVTRAKYDFPNELDSYISSNVLFGSCVTLVFYLLVYIFKDFFYDITNLDFTSLTIMLMMSCLLSPTLSFYQIKARINYQYKTATILSVLFSVLSLGGALLIGRLFENKYVGVIFGKNIGPFIIYVILFFLILKKGHRLYFKYIKYALSISLLVIPHVFSRVILQGSDKIMIEKMCSDMDLSLYSIAYVCGTIASFLLTSLNNAFIPWLFDSIKDNKREEIKRYSSILYIIFAVGTVVLMCMTPEIVLIIGGDKYKIAVYATLPIIASCCLQFMYTFYTNIEYYYKRTGWISIATIISSVINLVLNLLLIPRYGYIIAAYTTLLSYAVLCLMHWIVVRKVIKVNLLNDKLLFVISGIIILLSVVFGLIIENLLIRYVIIGLIITCGIILSCKNITRIKTILSSAGSKKRSSK